MSEIKFFIGPMSKNVVDGVREFSLSKGKKIALIPSRRQVEHSGGYVNNWTTKEFAKYTSGMFLCRDHAGPMQGYEKDDGLDSLKVDSQYFDMIHIDPWKETQDLDLGIELTCKLIDFCYRENKKVLYEVGTEQSIREFTPQEVNLMLRKIKNKLPTEMYKNIKYCVIQSGTSLEETTNTGKYNSVRLVEMLKVVT